SSPAVPRKTPSWPGTYSARPWPRRGSSVSPTSSPGPSPSDLRAARSYSATPRNRVPNHAPERPCPRLRQAHRAASPRLARECWTAVPPPDSLALIVALLLGDGVSEPDGFAGDRGGFLDRDDGCHREA